MTTTLKDIWEGKGLSPTQMAGLADVSLGTLYKVHRKEQVNRKNLVKVLKALELSQQEYDQLEAGK